MSGTADIARVKRALFAWVSLALVDTAAEDHVVIGRQGQLRMVRPYADVSIDSVQAEGHDEVGAFEGDAGARHVTGTRLVMVTVQIMGDGAMGLAETVRSFAWTQAAHRLFRLEGVAYLGADAVQDATLEMDTSMEERAVFVARVSFCSEQTETIGWIEHVEVEGTLEAPDGTDLEDDLFWVPESPA